MATRSLNKVILIGNLTRDPELRYTSSGTAVATFSVATNRNYTDSANNTVETAEFTNVVTWAKLAEICNQLLSKGSKVYIEGRLQTSSWTDQESGKTMRRTEVVATDMIVLSSPGGRPGSDSERHSSDDSSIPPSDSMNQDVDFNNLDIGEEVSSSSSDDSKSDSSDSDDDKKKEDNNETPF